MDYREFLKQIENKEVPKGIYLFYGEEEFIKDSMLRRLEDRCLEEATREINYTLLEGNVSEENVIAAAETLPLMGPARLVVVRDYAELKPPKKEKKEDEEKENAKQAVLTEYLNRMNPTTCLLFFNRGKVDKRRALYKAIAKIGSIVEFSPLNEYDRVRWIQSQAKRSGKRIAVNAAELLSFMTGAHLEDLFHELQKLVDYASGNEITVQDVEKVATRNAAYDVFKMIDALAARQLPQAQSELEQLLHNGEVPARVLILISRQFRLIRYAPLLNRILSREEAAKQLEVPDFVVRRAIGQARNFTEEQVEHALDACAKLDWEFKNGEIREDRLALRALLVDIHTYNCK